MTIAGPARPDDLVVAMTGASGAAYAVRLLQVLCRMGRTVHLTLSPERRSGAPRGAGAGSSTSTRSIRRSLGIRGPGRLVYHHHQDFSAGIASGSFPTGGMVVIPCSMSTLGSIAARDHDQPDHPRRRRPSEGAAEADPRPARDATEPDPPGEHGASHPGRGRRAAGDARLVPPAASARGPGGFHRGADLRSARAGQRPRPRDGGPAAPIRKMRRDGTHASTWMKRKPMSARSREPMAVETRENPARPRRPHHRRVGRASGRRWRGSWPGGRRTRPWC